MPKRKGGKEEVDPQVKEMFDVIWEVFLEIAEEEVVYPISAPLTTQKVLEEVEELVHYDFKDSLNEALSDTLCDVGFCIPHLIASYILSGGEELPTRGDLEECIGEYMAPCHETSESLDEFVGCINERYDCFLLLNKFFDVLPKMLEVKAVEGDIMPDLCSDEVTSGEVVANTMWYLGLRAPGTYGYNAPINLNYYGLRDGRIMVTGVGPRGSWCDEDFAEKEIPRLVEKLKELSIRPDLVVYVYGEPPVGFKAISPGLPVRRLEAPPEP
jgi:hypothetical protein